MSKLKEIEQSIKNLMDSIGEFSDYTKEESKEITSIKKLLIELESTVDNIINEASLYE